MKKVILTAVFAFATFTTFATTAIHSNPAQKVILVQEYKELPVEELPSAIQEAVKRDFKDAKIQKAFVNESKEFKLELLVGQATQTVYADANGNWLKKE
ncbi:hypothetical protein [Flavobacterium sp. J27]|uniref:hypothetical protein n=1 Tax=Flavobacterium sp. J27 TaxID=2060419 RepID=UPI001031100A|nr:hypothetical protein [Flavobacterium sp. J27]